MKEQYIAAVDFGSSKTALAVVKVEGNNATLVFFNTKDSGTSIRHSAIANTTKVSQNIKDLVKEAEDNLGIHIPLLLTSYPKYYIRLEKNQGEIKREKPEEGITKEEIEEIKSEAMYNYPLEDTEKENVIGAVAQSFSIDYDMNVPESNIIGVDGTALKGNFSIFIGKKNDSVRIDNAIKNIGIDMDDKCFSASWVADAVLTDNEKKTGVALIDFGGGATSVTIYCDEVLRHYASIPFGGKNITRDIASECGIDDELAEEIKLQYGGCIVARMQNLAEKTLRINYADSIKEVGIPYLTEIIQYRVKEIIEAICYEIECSGYADKLQNGVVITGGCANLLNICDLVKEISGYETKRGFDHKLNVNYADFEWFGDLSCCTLWGLLNYALKNDVCFLAEVDHAKLAEIRKKKEEGQEPKPVETQEVKPVPVAEPNEDPQPKPQPKPEPIEEPQPEPQPVGTDGGTLFGTDEYEVHRPEKPKKSKKVLRWLNKAIDKVQNEFEKDGGLFGPENQ